MTKEELIRMARECDLGRVCGPLDTLLDYEWEILQRFAHLVAEHEREECAKLCDDKAKETIIYHGQVWCDYFARVIRARGNT
jgi:hypothetical protein